MKLGIKGRRAAIEILIECLQAELAAMPPDVCEKAPEAPVVKANRTKTRRGSK